jgi:hypothetical protein
LCAETPLQRGDLLADRWLSNAFLAADGGKTAAFHQPHKHAHGIQTIHLFCSNQFQSGIDGMSPAGVSSIDQVSYDAV